MRRAYLLYLAGLLVAMFSLLAGPSVSVAAYGDYISTISTGGLNQPAKVAVNSITGDVYVTDAGNKAVKRYSYNGSYDSSFSLSVSGTPVGIATNGTNIFVGDDTNNCVWIYDMNGDLADLGSTGTTHKVGGSATSIKMPNTVTVAPSSHIFVVDGDSDKVYIFNSSGTINSSFGVSSSAASSGTTINLYYPTGLAMANSTGTTTKTQYFYLGDQGNNRVQKLSYAYNATTKAITTAPTYVQTIGTGAGDAFGKFLRVSDVAWDSVYSRLVVVDSLQMVAQLFDSAGATMGQAFNYSGGVQGYLNVPTGAVIASGKCYAASNQGGSLVMFNAASGNPPTVSTLSPAVDTTPSVTPYAINYTVNDSDSATVTISFYYEKIGTGTRVPISLNNPVTLVGGTYSGSVNWNWAVDPGPVVGSYKVVAVVLDNTSNAVEQYSTSSVLVVSPYDGCASYTNAHYALYGPANSDSDGDTIGNCDELNGTNHTDPLNTYTSDMNVADTDGDGLSDKQEDTAKSTYTLTCNLDPRNPDTDMGGISDYVEVMNAYNPCNGADDDGLAGNPQTIGGAVNIGDPLYIYDSYVEMQNISPTNTVIGDMIFRRASDATIISTIYALTIPPSGSKHIRIQDYTNEPNVSVDFVSYGTKYITGTITCYLVNHYDGQSLDADYMIPMDMGGGSNMLYTGFLNCGNARYVAWMTVRNPSSSGPVTARITWFNASGVQALQKDYLVPASSSIVINPNNEGLPLAQHYATIEGIGGNVSGYYVHFRKLTSDPTLLAFAFGISYETQMASKMVLDTFNDNVNVNGYKAWFSVTNPTAADVNITVNYYNTAGGAPVMTKVKTVPARKYIVWNPESNDLLPGGQYSADITTNGGELVGGYFTMFRRDTVTLEEAFNQGSVFQKDFTKTTLYAPYWNESTTNYSQHLPVSWFVLRNPGASAIDVTIRTYGLGGTPNASKVVTINPQALYAQRLRASNFPGLTVEEGSAKLTSVLSGTSTPAPFTGWIWRFSRNPYDGVSNDSGGGEALLPAP